MERGFVKQSKLIDKETDAGMMLFNVESGSMVELNSTAKLLWQKAGDNFTIDDLKKIIQEHCTGAENIDQDLSEFIETALKQNLVKENGKD